jgi:thiamine-monophosphate kinase
MHNEASLIETLTRSWKLDASVLKGVGDDCAVLSVGRLGGASRLLLKTDAVVENIHFLPETSPRLVGRKAIARVLSDFAAMGGMPWAAVVTLGRPVGTLLRRLQAIYRGMTQMASAYGLLLVGGETTTTTELVLSVAAVGRAVCAPVLRSGGRAGDYVYVTGELGGSWPRRHLAFTPRLAEGQWLARHGLVSAMMDVSDGLGVDLVRLAKACGVGVCLDEAAVPRWRGVGLSEAMEVGEDYELLFCVSPRKARRLEALWPFETRLTRIGVLGGELADMLRSWKWKGYDHVRLTGRKGV